MGRTIAIANQKGGVGKTTTTINLGAALADLSMKVLIIDLDPQGNASTGLGIGAERRRLTSYDLLLGDEGPEQLIQQTSVENLFIIPSTTDLSSADIEFVSRAKRAFLLRDALNAPELLQKDFDFVLIDCPPSLNMLTVNAMAAASSVLIPLQAEFFALEGLSQLLLTVREMRRSANPALRIEGVVLTMVDRRNRLSQQVESDARSTLGDIVFQTTIPRNVRISESPSYALPVLRYDQASKGSEAYRALAREMLAKQRSGITEGSR